MLWHSLLSPSAIPLLKKTSVEQNTNLTGSLEVRTKINNNTYWKQVVKALSIIFKINKYIFLVH